MKTLKAAGRLQKENERLQKINLELLGAARCAGDALINGNEQHVRVAIGMLHKAIAKAEEGKS